MHVMITGAAGFVGANLTRALLSGGHEVTGVDFVPPGEAWRLDQMGLRECPGYKYVWSGVSDIRSVPPYVVHCAAATNVGNVAENPQHGTRITVNDTVSLLEAARHSPVERFILVSTHSVYGKQEIQPILEDIVPAPGNLYGAMKVFQEQASLAYLRSFDLPVVVIRSATVYGEFERSGALVRTFLERALRDQVITVTGDGLQSRDLTHVQNTCNGLVQALLAPAEAVVGETINLGAGEDIAIGALAKMAIEEMGGGRIEWADPRPGEEGRLSLSLAKARARLGYSPGIKFAAGFKLVAEWVRDLEGASPLEGDV